MLITIAFLDKILRSPKYLLLILLPIALFAISLLCSLYVFKIFGDFHAHVVTFHVTLRSTVMTLGAGTAEKKDIEGTKSAVERTREELKAIGTKVNRFQGPAIWAYFLGLMTLIAFALINLTSVY